MIDEEAERRECREGENEAGGMVNKMRQKAASDNGSQRH